MIFIRYGLVAGLAYCIDFGGYIFLLGVGYTPLVSNALVKVIAAIFGFFAHRYFTYLMRGVDGIRQQAVRYFGLVAFYTPISSVLLYVIMIYLSTPMYAKATSDISLFILMFWITSKFAFIKTNKQT